MGQGKRGKTHKEAAEIIPQTARTNTLVMQIHVFRSPRKKK